jgi:hypothetical protein
MKLLPLLLAIGGLVAAAIVVALVFGTSGDADDTDSVDAPPAPTSVDPSTIEDMDTSTLDGYFVTLNIVQIDIRSQYSALQAEYPEQFVEQQQTIDFLNASVDVWGEGADLLGVIDAPEPATAAHADLIASTDDVSATFGTLATEAQSASDATALSGVADNADTTAFDAYAESCAALQGIATENDIMDEAGQPFVVVC